MKVFGRAVADGRGLSFFSLPVLPRLVKVRRESNSKGVDDVDPEGAGGCKAENLFKLEALDRKASIGVED